VKLTVAWIGRSKDSAINTLSAEYLKRISRYTQVEGLAVRDEDALLELCGDPGKKKTTAKSTLVLMDSKGRQLSSEEFARFVGDYQDRNPIPLVFAVGPADGFSASARSVAAHVVSFGPMTLPHELARVVLVEQLYRAFTILKGHPYHLGH